MLRLLKRKKTAPEIDKYISHRYEDTAVIIFANIREGRGVYSAFVPWIQSMLMQYIPADDVRLKYWHDQVPLFYGTILQQGNNAWTEERTTKVKGNLENLEPIGRTRNNSNRTFVKTTPINDDSMFDHSKTVDLLVPKPPPVVVNQEKISIKPPDSGPDRVHLDHSILDRNVLFDTDHPSAVIGRSKFCIIL